MNNVILDEAEVVTLVAPYAVASGAGALVGSIFGAATSAVASGASGEFKRKGVLDMAKVSTEVWSVGAKIYWDDTAKLCTSVSTSNTLVGAAAAVTANPSATGWVLLDGTIR